MTLRNIIVATTACLIVGALFFLMHRKILVVQLNVGNPILSATSFDTADHKTVKLYYKKNSAWSHETATLVWHQNNDAHNIKQLINQWIMTVTDEHLIPKNITLESVALATPGTDLYISFDRTLFDKDASIMHKWNVVEGLLKTIHSVNSSIQAITLQVHHKTMPDDHLELSQAIPVQEFCS